MSKSKVKIGLWKKGLELKPHGENFYTVDGFWWRQTQWGHGNSKGIANCPCCKAETEFYIWSIAGAGKKCSGCGLVLYLGGPLISKTVAEAYFDLEKCNEL